MALQEQYKRQGDFLFKNRGHLPLIIIVIGLAVFIEGILNKNNSGLTSCFPIFETFKYEFSFFIGLIGVFIRCHVVGYAPDRTSGRNIDTQIADVLNTNGLYSIVRHPLYVGNFFMWLSPTLLTSNAWFTVSFILFYILYYERIMIAEEFFLRDKFKDQYIDWANKTPAAIPNFNLYQKADTSFKFIEVLKREKNGVLALFILFWIFELIENSILSEEFVLKYSFWFYGLIVTLIYYLIRKIKKISTRN